MTERAPESPAVAGRDREPDAFRGRIVALRRVTAQDVEALRQIHSTPAVIRWWGPPEEGFPLTDDPDASRLSILVDGETAGMIQFSEEAQPEYRHAAIDVFLAPDLHGRGFGTDAVVTLLHHLIDDLGHHRVTIDPAVDNLAAIRCYEKAGFRRIGVMHRAWRDPDRHWRDVLFMEHVAP